MENMAISPNQRCSQIGCKVHEDGKCLESLPLDSCPHFYLSENEEILNEESNENNTERLFLYHGRELAIDETGIVLNSVGAKLILLIGESDSGKTTFLAELFNRFQKGPFGKYNFSGSYTLKGFEERSFLSLADSGEQFPVTKRTNSKEFNFLHLAFAEDCINDDYLNHHLLISDISGEIFRDARSSSTLMKELTIMPKADNILFLLDGEKLADRRLRTSVIEEGKMFIQRALDEEMINTKSNIKIVVSKWDKLANDETFDFDTLISTPFSTKFLNRIGTLTYDKVACRSFNKNIEHGFGLLKTLNWFCSDILNDKKNEITVDYSKESSRFISKLTYQVL